MISHPWGWVGSGPGPEWEGRERRRRQGRHAGASDPANAKGAPPGPTNKGKEGPSRQERRPSLLPLENLDLERVQLKATIVGMVFVVLRCAGVLQVEEGGGEYRHSWIVCFLNTSGLVQC